MPTIEDFINKNKTSLFLGLQNIRMEVLEITHIFPTQDDLSHYQYIAPELHVLTSIISF